MRNPAKFWKNFAPGTCAASYSACRKAFLVCLPQKSEISASWPGHSCRQPSSPLACPGCKKGENRPASRLMLSRGSSPAIPALQASLVQVFPDWKGTSSSNPARINPHIPHSGSGEGDFGRQEICPLIAGSILRPQEAGEISKGNQAI